MASPVAAQLPAAAQTFLLGKSAKGVTGTQVAPGDAYDPVRGHGFVSTPNGNEQAFSVKAPPGDYAVTVMLGGPKPSRTSLWAEDRRLMAGPAILAAGKTRSVTFTVNVRDASLTPDVQDGVAYPHVMLRANDMPSRSWDDQLTVAVSGSAPMLNAITIAPVQARRVLIAGDSTVTDQAGGDYASWGQMLPRFLDPALSVANHARSGETMKGFLTSLRWDKLMSETRPGDVVLIQFGHNDEKKQWPHTYSAPDGAYPAFLAALVADARQHGATPVILSPVARLSFGPDGKIGNSHQGYDEAVRRVGAQFNVPVIDLTLMTAQMYETLGRDLAPMAFANGGKEKTHHNTYGAWMIACMVAHDLAVMPGLGVKTAADAPACTPDKPADPRAYEIQPGDWPIMRVRAAQGAEVTPLK